MPSGYSGMDGCGEEIMADEKTVVNEKYKGKPIRFNDKGDHYELIFADEFRIPGRQDELRDQVVTDVVEDMINADHDKEIHVFVASYGGSCYCLCMLLQQLLEFNHRVAINLGMADSAGWMLTFACQELYGSPFCDYMYHEMSSIYFGKISESKRITSFASELWAELLKRTDTDKVLTMDERKLGETSEVWLTGAELIRRGAIKDYSEYRKRVKISKSEDMYHVGDRIFKHVDDKYVEYVKCVGHEYSYQELMNLEKSVELKSKKRK